MKKIFLTEADRKKIISDREKAIVESFAKTFNKIKRIDENELNEEVNPLDNITKKVKEVIKGQDGPNSKYLEVLFNDNSYVVLYQQLKGDKRFEIPREYENYRYDAYRLYNLLGNRGHEYWDMYKYFENMVVNADNGESLNEFEFDMPRKPVTNDDYSKFDDRERMKTRLDGFFHNNDMRDIKLVNSEEDDNTRADFGDGNIVIRTNSGNLPSEVESEISRMLESNNWKLESFIDGLYLAYQGGDTYGHRYQGSL
jgi:hypothetical protein